MIFRDKIIYKKSKKTFDPEIFLMIWYKPL